MSVLSPFLRIPLTYKLNQQRLIVCLLRAKHWTSWMGTQNEAVNIHAFNRGLPSQEQCAGHCSGAGGGGGEVTGESVVLVASTVWWRSKMWQ